MWLYKVNSLFFGIFFSFYIGICFFCFWSLGPEGAGRGAGFRNRYRLGRAREETKMPPLCVASGGSGGKQPYRETGNEPTLARSMRTRWPHTSIEPQTLSYINFVLNWRFCWAALTTARAPIGRRHGNKAHISLTIERQGVGPSPRSHLDYQFRAGWREKVWPKEKAAWPPLRNGHSRKWTKIRDEN